MKKSFTLLFAISCFTILFFSCQKEYSNETGSFHIASGSLLTDSLGNCMPDTVVGTFYNGITPGSDTAYVEVQVDVTETGSYSVYTNFQNGFKFADSGVFTTTGINTVRLKPLGTPIVQVPTIFTISFDSSFCSFVVNVKDSTGTGLGGNQDTAGTGDPDTTVNQWQFGQGSFSYAGMFDSAKKDNSTGLATYIDLNGSTTATGDTTMSLKFIIPAADIQTGTYTLISNGIFFTVVDANTLTVLYEADGLTASTDFTINITAYNSATKLVHGNFSGSAKDASGNIVPITNGSFVATVQ